MKCCVEGCERDSHYKAAQLCQMHYFRQRRSIRMTEIRDHYRAKVKEMRK